MAHRQPSPPLPISLSLLARLPVAWGESAGEVGIRTFPHSISRSEFETVIPTSLVSCTMRLFHCQQKMDVANGSVEVVLKFLSPGYFPTNEPCGPCSKNGG